MKESRKRK